MLAGSARAAAKYTGIVAGATLADREDTRPDRARPSARGQTSTPENLEAVHNHDERRVTLTAIDVLILTMYGVCVLGIGFALRRRVVDSQDFFLAGRSIPAWTAGLAFLSANLGAQEMIGMAASGAKYGILTSHFYWIGAIPAMVFVGVFMMPFYYGSRARSVPEYLKLRFDEKTRGFNAVTFAVMTVFSSGISMYAMGALLSLLLGWNINVSIVASALVVLCYIALGGLTSAIYNEVLQFFLIVFGFAPLVYLGLREVGGWQGLAARVPDTFVHAWANLGDAGANPMGVEWFGLVMGLGFVLSFGYWCTDFLVVQRAMAADSMNAARLTPLIAAVPKMLFPFLIIVPGLIALALTTNVAAGSAPLLPRMANGSYDYNMALPQLMARYYPSGLLGLGLTGLSQASCPGWRAMSPPSIPCGPTTFIRRT
jgi:solute:Na+ symporter, SSS family